MKSKVIKRLLSGVLGVSILCTANAVTVFAEVTHTHTVSDIKNGTVENPVLWDTTVSMWNDAKLEDDSVLTAAPARRVFKTKNTANVPFVLLDSVNAGENDGYFVMRQRSVTFADSYSSGIYLALKFWDEAKAAAGAVASTSVFNYDPGDPRSIAYWLNRPEFESLTDQANNPTNVTNKTGYVIIPEEMRSYVENRTWWQEQALIYTGSDITGTKPPFSVTCKYNLLSVTEYVLNKQYISVTQSGDANINDDTNSWARTQVIMTRTPGRGANERYSVLNGAGNVDAKDMATYVKARLRPCFYLSADFFKNVRLDIATMGDDIKSLMVNDIPLEDAQRIYSINELLQMGYDVPDSDAVAGIVSQGFNEDRTKYSMVLRKTSTLKGKYTLAVCGYADRTFTAEDGTTKTLPQLTNIAYAPIVINAEDSGRRTVEIDVNFASSCDDVQVYLWKYPKLEKVVLEEGGRILP